MYEKVCKEVISYSGNDVRRINHTLKVWAFARIIAENEKLDLFGTDVVNYTAILHDIGIKEAERKYNSNSGGYQEKEGPAIAKDILTRVGVDSITIERVCFIIGHHHTYSKIDGIDFQIIVEADLLVNIYEDNVKREAIQSFEERYFKTDTGLNLIRTMYLYQEGVE
jgi:HD superfamily phosphodiesterase